MSNLVFIVAIFLLSLHACTARHSFDLVSYTKLQDEEKTKVVDELDVMPFSMFEDTQETSSAGRTEDTPIATLHRTLKPHMEMKGLKGKPRSMLETNKSYENKHETTDARQGEHVEDAVVMDYVVPRRKSPIHNHH